MNWIQLTGEDQLQEIITQSGITPQVVFKHSTRCSVSSIVLNRLNEGKQTVDADFYYLDLLKYRSLSNKISEIFSKQHESPQVLLIKNGKCTYVESHIGITMKELMEQTLPA